MIGATSAPVDLRPLMRRWRLAPAGTGRNLAGTYRWQRTPVITVCDQYRFLPARISAGQCRCKSDREKTARFSTGCSRSKSDREKTARFSTGCSRYNLYRQCVGHNSRRFQPASLRRGFCPPYLLAGKMPVIYLPCETHAGAAAAVRGCGGALCPDGAVWAAGRGRHYATYCFR